VTRRRLRWAVVATAFLAVADFRRPLPAEKIAQLTTSWKYRQVKAGMTYDEVVGIVGVPWLSLPPPANKLPGTPAYTMAHSWKCEEGILIAWLRRQNPWCIMVDVISR